MATSATCLISCGQKQKLYEQNLPEHPENATTDSGEDVDILPCFEKARRFRKKFFFQLRGDVTQQHHYRNIKLSYCLEDLKSKRKSLSILPTVTLNRIDLSLPVLSVANINPIIFLISYHYYLIANRCQLGHLNDDIIFCQEIFNASSL